MADFYCNQVLQGNVAVSVVFETDLVLAFHHTQRYFEHHIVIIPKQHIESLSSLQAVESTLAVDFLKAIQYVCDKLERENGGCRVSSNVGDYQSTRHLHFYVHSGKRLRNEDGSIVEI